MDEAQRSARPLADKTAQAVAPPPVVYLPPMIAGLLLHFLWEPLRLFPEWWIGHAVGWPVIVVSGVLVVWAVRTMWRAGEDPNVYKPTKTIVSHGPFGFSRNPMYVSLTLLYVGVALIVNTIWLAAFLPAALMSIHYGVIIREERYLERLFGDEYRRYRGRVRRWL